MGPEKATDWSDAGWAIREKSITGSKNEGFSDQGGTEFNIL